MFSKVALIVAASMAIFAAASPVPGDGGQCNTGPTHCCNSVQDSHSPNVSLIAALLGLDLSGVTGQVGVNCSPLSVIGLGGNSCTQQPVCCSGNNFNGLIVVGCTPINVNL